MKKNSIYLLLLTFVLVAGCDRIERDEYMVASSGSGSNGQWTNGGVQRALVEKYTGPRCNNCPLADETLDALHEQYASELVIIAITPYNNIMADPFPNQLDPRTTVGTTWAEHFGISGLPSACINRDRSTLYDGAMENIGSAIAGVIAGEPMIGLNLSIEADTASRTLDITAAVDVYNTITDELTLTLVLTEDSLRYRQLSPEGIKNDYVHNHMLREAITATWGEAIPLAGTPGEHKEKHFVYTVADPTINLMNSNVVGFIARKSDRTVLNSQEVQIFTHPIEN